MAIAVLVQAHKYPQQINRMLRPFYEYDDIDIYVNIDKKIDIDPFKDSLGEHVHFIENRVPIFWSNISQVNGMLNSFQEILSKQKYYDNYIFMSGQDYIVTPIEDILSFLEKNKGKEFIECEEISKDGLNWEVRYKKYHFTHLNNFWQKIGQLIRQLPFINRTYPLFEKTYGGSAWFILTHQAIEYVVEFCRDHKPFVDFHKYSHCPDEYFFQTLLMNSHFRENIIHKNFWYIDWFSRSNNPKILCSSHFDRIIDSNNFFARKFDYKIDSDVLDMIDRHKWQKRSSNLN